MARWDDRLGADDTGLNSPNGYKKEDDGPQIGEVTVSISEVHEAARNSMDFLAALAMPLIFKYFFPKVYQAVWKWLLSYVHRSRDFSQLALGLPRGFAKTSVIKLFVLYCILFTSRKFILICCENQTKGNGVLSDIMDMLEESNIIKIFGNWKIGAETDRQDVKKFGFRGRNIVLMASTVQTVRGINLKNARPDIMIFDDIQSRADAESEIISKQIETDMIGTAMKAKSPEGCLFVFIGNMYPTKWSILRKLKTNPNWMKFIAGGILEDGTSLWEDLQPISQLIKEYENDLAMGRPEIFHAEVLNDENATVNNLLQIDKIPPYNIPDDEPHQGNFIIIDPASGRADGDSVTIGYAEVHQGVPAAKEINEGRFSPGQCIEVALEMALRRNCRLIAIESNSYQYTLGYWFNYITAQRGIIGIECVELYSGVNSKNARILTMFKQLLAGEIKYHPRVAPQVHLQITTFNPIKRDNTDGILDFLTYMPKVIELYSEFILANLTIEMQEFAAIEIGGVETTSCF